MVEGPATRHSQISPSPQARLQLGYPGNPGLGEGHQVVDIFISIQVYWITLGLAYYPRPKALAKEIVGGRSTAAYFHLWSDLKLQENEGKNSNSGVCSHTETRVSEIKFGRKRQSGWIWHYCVGMAVNEQSRLLWSINRVTFHSAHWLLFHRT